MTYRSFSAYLLTVTVLAFLFTSCEKVIDVDLNDSAAKYVVEAVVADQPGSCKVLVTQTKNFSENNTFNGISGARVTIADNNGSPQLLTETSAGVYEARLLIGIPLHTYQLTVNVSGQVYTASSTMPARVRFDSLSISERSFFDDKFKYATVFYNDPAGQQNAYRYIQYVNGVKEKTIFARDDDANDGRPIERTLFYFYDDDEKEQRQIKTGDTVRVDFLNIEYAVYKYWYSLGESSTGENQSATPGNPVTNIQGGALGYFSAHTIESKTVVAP